MVTIKKQQTFVNQPDPWTNELRVVLYLLSCKGMEIMDEST